MLTRQTAGYCTKSQTHRSQYNYGPQKGTSRQQEGCATPLISLTHQLVATPEPPLMSWLVDQWLVALPATARSLPSNQWLDEWLDGNGPGPLKGSTRGREKGAGRAKDRRNQKRGTSEVSKRRPGGRARRTGGTNREEGEEVGKVREGIRKLGRTGEKSKSETGEWTRSSQITTARAEAHCKDSHSPAWPRPTIKKNQHSFLRCLQPVYSSDWQEVIA